MLSATVVQARILDTMFIGLWNHNWLWKTAHEHRTEFNTLMADKSTLLHHLYCKATPGFTNLWTSCLKLSLAQLLLITSAYPAAVYNALCKGYKRNYPILRFILRVQNLCETRVGFSIWLKSQEVTLSDRFNKQINRYNFLRHFAKPFMAFAPKSKL